MKVYKVFKITLLCICCMIVLYKFQPGPLFHSGHAVADIVFNYLKRKQTTGPILCSFCDYRGVLKGRTLI